MYLVLIFETLLYSFSCIYSSLKYGFCDSLQIIVFIAFALALGPLNDDSLNNIETDRNYLKKIFFGDGDLKMDISIENSKLNLLR